MVGSYRIGYNINEVHNILKEEIAAVKANELSSQVNLGSRVNASSVSRKSTIAKKDGDGADQMVLKGYFLKKNWMGRSQMRLFCLYSNGEIKYFDNKNQKGAIWVRNDTEVVMNKKNEIVLSNIESSSNK